MFALMLNLWDLVGTNPDTRNLKTVYFLDMCILKPQTFIILYC